MAQQAINYALESAIVSYLNGLNSTSGSLLSGSGVTYYTSIGNVDLSNAPLCVVECYDCKEVVFNTRNYEIYTRIAIKEIAADTFNSSVGGTGAPLGTLAGAIFNEFDNSISASNNVTSASLASSNSHVAVWQVRQIGRMPEVAGDALVNGTEYVFVAALVQ